jgi:hypothetical protein
MENHQNTSQLLICYGNVNSDLEILKIFSSEINVLKITHVSFPIRYPAMENLSWELSLYALNTNISVIILTAKYHVKNDGRCK